MSHRFVDDQATSDRQAQARLERMLAARRAAEAAREVRYRTLRTPRSQYRANEKAPMRPIGATPPPLRPAPKRSAWADLAAFLKPIAITVVLGLLAHWAGWL